jgi:DNA-nicking Smr family endonuclease
VPPDITTRLHRGDFSIQDHLDLHGLSVAEAEAAFEAFLKTCIGAGKRAVLVIHGRGLSSPAQPVLKTKVYQWLTRTRWRKWVIAFTSARSCDGGAGASYILLRQRPLTKKQRKAGFKGHQSRPDQYCRLGPDQT